MRSMKFISVYNKMIMELHEVVTQCANRAQHMLIAGNTKTASMSSVHFLNMMWWIVSMQSGPLVFMYKYAVSCPQNSALNKRVLPFTIL
jgi:hypothetical protein